MPDKAGGLQDRFLNAVRREKVPVGLFLVKGVKLQGVITWFDAFSLLLRREGAGQLVYKHAIASIQPMRELTEFDPGQLAEKPNPDLQDRFLDSAERAGEGMRLYLVSGIMLEGVVSAHDQFSVLLKRGDELQLIYKHAISTLQPQRDLDLGSGDIS